MEFQITALEEASQSEVQRRTDSREELIATIPEDVLTILTEGDENERVKQQAVITSHQRYVENSRKFIVKLREEDKQHQQRLEQSYDASNPSAAEAANLRHQQAKSRIQADFKDQMMRYVMNYYCSIHFLITWILLYFMLYICIYFVAYFCRFLYVNKSSL